MKIIRIDEQPLKYLKTFLITYLDRFSQEQKWEMVSRQGLDRLENEIYHHTAYTDGAMIVAYNESKTKTVMVREYRPVAGGYVYAFPAGLCDEDEEIEITSVREFKEETGLDFHYEGQDGPRYTTVGLTNERVHTVFGTFSGEISQDYLDGSEDIEAVIVDREEAIRLLKEEEVPIRSAFLLMNIFQLPLFDPEVK